MKTRDITSAYKAKGGKYITVFRNTLKSGTVRIKFWLCSDHKLAARILRKHGANKVIAEYNERMRCYSVTGYWGEVPYQAPKATKPKPRVCQCCKRPL